MASLWRRRKTDLKFWVDVLLFLSAVGLVVIGLLLGFVLPKGPAAPEQSKVFLGLHRHAWGDLHLYLGLAFTAFGVLHVVLGWSWVKGKTKSLFPRRWAPALVSMPVAALLLLVGLWGASRQGPPKYTEHGGDHAPGHERVRGQATVITGRMTLREVEAATGFPARQVVDRLGLPADVSLDAPLREITHAHGLSVQDVRALVAPGAESPAAR